MRRACIAAVCVACNEPTESIDEQADTVCADGPIVKGIDVSYYEASVDWAIAKQAGIEFAFIRASDGLQFIDPKFPEYWAGAKQAGVVRGAYQFFRPAEDAIAQADLLLQKIGAIEPGDLPPVLDVEVNGGLAPAQVAAAVKTWVDHVTPVIGRPPIIYAGLYSWHDLTSSANMTASPLWVAQYTSAACPNIPLPWTRWAFWQYSSTGSVPGIPGAALDVDVFNGTHDDLVSFATAQPAAPCGSIPPEGGEIDNGDDCFATGGPPAYLRHASDAGEGGDLIWTNTTASPSEADWAQWNLDLTESGRYLVEVYTAHAYAQATQAAYEITAGGAKTRIVLDQSAVDGWQALGEFEFAAGGAQAIHLGDNTGESPHQLVFDAVRLTRLDAPNQDGGCATTGGAGWLVALVLTTLRGRRRRSARELLGPVAERTRQWGLGGDVEAKPHRLVREHADRPVELGQSDVGGDVMAQQERPVTQHDRADRKAVLVEQRGAQREVCFCQQLRDHGEPRPVDHGEWCDP